MNVDDERLGRLLRLMRTDASKTQLQLAQAAQVPLKDLKRIEAGRAADVRLGRIRSLFEALDGRTRLVPWWKGATADRLLDSRHAAIAERVVALFVSRPPWQPHPEFSFSEFGERGSIDIFAAHPPARAVAVCEVKSIIGSLEETNRTLDAKVRLAPTIAYKTFGWRPLTVARVLILPDDSTTRRVIAAHSATMNRLYPARSRELRSWLRQPGTPVSAIWFVSFRPNGAIDRR